MLIIRFPSKKAKRRARRFAQDATAGGEGMARMDHVNTLQEKLLKIG